MTEQDFVREALIALERVQKSRVWFEPYSDCLNPICEAIYALEVLARYEAVFASGGDPKKYRDAKLRPAYDDMRS